MSDPSLLDCAIVKLYKGINKIVLLRKLPKHLGVFNPLALRIGLRAKNLYNVYLNVTSQGTLEVCPITDLQYKTVHNSNGKFNSVREP
jgi:hypothetical protein